MAQIKVQYEAVNAAAGQVQATVGAMGGQMERLKTLAKQQKVHWEGTSTNDAFEQVLHEWEKVQAALAANQMVFGKRMQDAVQAFQTTESRLARSFGGGGVHHV